MLVADILPLPTNVTKAIVQSADPGCPAASGVTKTGSPVSGDLVTVDLIEQTTIAGKVVVVLKVRANSGVTATLNGDGSVTINAFGNSATTHVILDLATGDASNWTAKVKTSGGTNYTFIKGNGG